MGSIDIFFEARSKGLIKSIEDTMKYEALRLATFNTRPRSYNTVSAVRLANAGFYYPGAKDAATCFKCNLNVVDWSSYGSPIDPFAIHMEKSPDCPFVSDTDKENVAYAMTELPQEARALKDEISIRSKPSLSKFPARSNQLQPGATFGNHEIETDCPTIPHVQIPQLLSNVAQNCRNAPLNPPRNQTQEFVNRPGLTSNTLFNPPPSLTNYLPLHNTFGTNRHAERPPLFENDTRATPNFKYEQDRLDTYTYWPNGSAVRPSELAKAGFYYLGTEDRVQCTFCKGVLRNWDPTDHAIDEHKKHFPSCPFIRDAKNSGNVPLKDQLSGVHLRKDMKTSQELEEYLLGIMTERAYHPSMAMKIERLNTYVNFHSDSSKSKEEFAEAGFFFTGQGDNVKCFFCDGGLRNWERNDDPWLEHARWFPKCGYLRTKKGEKYVKDIRKKYAPPGTKKPRVRKMKMLHKVNEEDVAAMMKQDMIGDAYEMGFTYTKIEEVIRRRFGELGSEFPNIESLMDSLYETEELEQQGSDSESDSEEMSSEVNIEQSNTGIETDGNKASPENETNANEKTDKKKKRKKNKKKKAADGQGEGQSGAISVNPFDLVNDDKAGPELEAEVQKLKDERVCKVCMDSEVNIVFLKCGHLVCCSDCAPAMRHCPICREAIRGTIRVFLS